MGGGGGLVGGGKKNGDFCRNMTPSCDPSITGSYKRKKTEARGVELAKLEREER